MDGIWIVYLFLAAFPGLIVCAAVYKYIEVSRAARWPSAPGRVVRSGQETRRVRSGGPDSDDTETRNFAKIVYEYTVAGRQYRCDRVSIGENLGNFQVAEALSKYPVGKPVTVYYDPVERSKAVLADVAAFVGGGAARYPKGEVVEVHYNPENPVESVLDPRAWPLLLLWLIRWPCWRWYMWSEGDGRWASR